MLAHTSPHHTRHARLGAPHTTHQATRRHNTVAGTPACGTFPPPPCCQPHRRRRACVPARAAGRHGVGHISVARTRPGRPFCATSCLRMAAGQGNSTNSLTLFHPHPQKHLGTCGHTPIPAAMGSNFVGDAVTKLEKLWRERMHVPGNFEDDPMFADQCTWITAYIFANDRGLSEADILKQFAFPQASTVAPQVSKVGVPVVCCVSHTTLMLVLVFQHYTGAGAQQAGAGPGAVQNVAGTNTQAQAHKEGTPITAGRAAGRHVTAAGAAGRHVTAAGAAGRHVTAAGAAGRHVTTAGAAGRHITAAGAAGRHVTAAGAAGRHVTTAGAAGRHITAAGATGSAGRFIPARHVTADGAGAGAAARRHADVSSAAVAEAGGWTAEPTGSTSGVCAEIHRAYG